MVDNQISIWLEADKESQLSNRELAAYLSISVATLQQRLRTLGPDHCLTYYPGPIPPRYRGPKKTGPKSTLSAIKIERLTERDLDARTCMRLITKLIHHSLDDLTRFGCRSSEVFLSNQDGMLHYYLELVPGIDVQTCLNYAQGRVLEIKLLRRGRG